MMPKYFSAPEYQAQRKRGRKIFEEGASKFLKEKADLKYLENRPFNVGEIAKIWKVLKALIR